jgi:hypothetical protein
VLGDSSESTDTRQAGKGVYLTREQVDDGQRRFWQSRMSPMMMMRKSMCGTLEKHEDGADH